MTKDESLSTKGLSSLVVRHSSFVLRLRAVFVSCLRAVYNLT